VICPPPIDPPPRTRQADPAEPLHRRAACVVGERCGTRVKAACVGRVVPPESLRVQVVTALVAEGADQRAEGGDGLADGRPHPDPDPHHVRRVVAEPLKGPPPAWTRRGRAARTRTPGQGAR
jgi:hypothetical protein